jgi:hypothetical protein
MNMRIVGNTREPPLHRTFRVVGASFNYWLLAITFSLLNHLSRFSITFLASQSQ